MARTIVAADIKRRLQIPGGTYDCTMVNTGDTITSVLHGRTAGDVLTFSATTGGVVVGTKYYVINVTTADVFQISATRGGAAFTLNADGANTFTVLSQYDGDITNLITELQAAYELTIDPTILAGGTIDNLLKSAMVECISGAFLEALKKVRGASESIVIAGENIGAWSVDGKQLIEHGELMMSPWIRMQVTLNATETAKAAFETAKANAESAVISALSTANKDKVVAEIAQLTAVELKIDAETAKLTAEELKVDKEALLIAEQTALATAKTALVTAQIAALTGAGIVADDTPHSNTTDTDQVFGLESAEYI